MNHLISQEWIDGQMAKLKAQGYRFIQTSLVGTKFRENPCVAYYGKGPEGKLCKTCEHFFRKQYSKVYRKCDLRGNTNGPGTDHKATWPACAKYVEAKP